MDFKHRFKLARKTKKGDLWIHRKTKKTVLVLGRERYDGVKLLHESGIETVKFDHYLASDYEPNLKKILPEKGE